MNKLANMKSAIVDMYREILDSGDAIYKLQKAEKPFNKELAEHRNLNKIYNQMIEEYNTARKGI